MKTVAKSFVVLALMGMTLSACGNSTTKNNVTTTTVGAELEALDKAYSDGLLNEKEYKQQREKILKRK
ncbi:hypothetical protein [Shimia aestuarii]|uniref:Short C-terminal domain-containing protein n=1 Tax=Shimia aestuarii TaxID=254406 RepID=A0A1I4HW35_9RHOB|nr:hypothetical protein [Shimia aestuarii]SFL46409.1 hypothetical protein SAMN04488042_101298 [Shimia aestuarii]